jgi:hypothetical protein
MIKTPPTKAALRDTKVLCGDPGNLFRIVSARRIDLDYLARDDLANRVISINQVKRTQCEPESAVESLDLFRLDLAIPKQPIDRH